MESCSFVPARRADAVFPGGNYCRHRSGAVSYTHLSHVAVTPDDADLEELFKDLAANISKTGATNIVIDEVVNADFIITSVSAPTKGSVMTLSSNALQWKIPELGVSANEGASLEFFIQHIGTDSGDKLVNESITYSDDEGNAVVFPTPSVDVYKRQPVKR